MVSDLAPKKLDSRRQGSRQLIAAALSTQLRLFCVLDGHFGRVPKLAAGFCTATTRIGVKGKPFTGGGMVQTDPERVRAATANDGLYAFDVDYSPAAMEVATAE